MCDLHGCGRRTPSSSQRIQDQNVGRKSLLHPRVYLPLPNRSAYAQVVPVASGSNTLKDAINEAMRDWVTNLSTTHYLVGSAIGPHPFPTIVRDFQRVIGREIKSQLSEARGKLPDAVVACVGGGSNAIGTFYDFIGDRAVRLVGVEAGGDGKKLSITLKKIL